MKTRWLTAIVSALITLFLVLFANHVLGINYRACEWHKSPNGNLYLAEVTGRYGRFSTYLVVKNNEVQYATKSCFDNRGRIQGVWGMNSDDFFIVSYSSGVYYYRNEGGKWEEYFLYYLKDENGNLTCTIQPSDVANQVSENFDIVNIPQVVNNYIENTLQR